MDRELILVDILASQMAEQHLDFIKTKGERGRSAMADLAVFEDLEKSETNRYATLKTECFILSALVQAVLEELRRMEEEKKKSRI